MQCHTFQVKQVGNAGVGIFSAHSSLAWRGSVAATPNDITASVHVLDCPELGWPQRNQRLFMMNQTAGWMSGWAMGGMWVWTVAGILLVALLVVVNNKVVQNIIQRLALL